MKKITIALCLGEKKYKERFEKCWMNHYKHQYDLYLFSETQELLQTDVKEFGVIITDDLRTSKLKELNKRGKKIIALWETKSDITALEDLEEVVFTAKYQELYKIEEEVKRQIKIEETSCKRSTRTSEKCKIVGVFSLDCEGMQIPFSALAACEYGEETETLLINLQAYSGFEIGTEEETAGFLGMEDLMTMSTTESFSRGRVLGAIGHEQNWDYIYPVKNAEFISEGNGQLYQKIITLMVEEFGYQTIIINFGVAFAGMSELIEQCDEFYLLVSKEESLSWRERDFQKYLERKEKKAFVQQIKRIEIPSVFWSERRDWKKLTQQWRWSEIGDKLRKYAWAGL